MKTSRSLNRIDLLFRAFSDRTRLRLLNLLTTGEVCVCDLVAVLKVPQSKISRHLAALRKAGLVVVRKDGYWSYYRLAPATDALRAQLFKCLSCCLREVPEFLKDLKALKINCGISCCE